MNAPSQTTANFANVSRDDALRRANELVPALRSRAARAESERILLPETVADLHAMGAFRVLQPRRWGGMEHDYIAYIDIPMALARGCASTSWCVVNLMIHNWMLALYDERAQADVWGADPAVLIAAGIAFPQGRARKVDGGYIISGKWNFSSGVHVSDWCMLAGTVREDAPAGADGSGKPVDYRMCLLHKSQYQVIDDWHVMGMRSTGSMTVTATDVFVPEYRALSMLDARGGATFPGARTNPNPLYQIALSAMGGHGLASTAVGNAMAALEFTRDMVKARSTNYTGSRMRDFQVVQLRVGTAGAKIDAARQMLRSDALEAMDIARSGAVPDLETKLRYKRNAAYIAQLATEAVDGLHTVTGATGVYNSYPLERIFRDAHALAAHISLNFDAQAASWGLAVLGGEVNVPTL
jgi:3-hydroxy-9,10-secoandrosta-1,3,5(10)-triene-9,17-dione monooxygenase